MTEHVQIPEAGRRTRRIGLVIGPVVSIGMLAAPAPEGVPTGAWTVAALAVLMAVWWMTEALPLAATALAPIVLLPLLDVAPMDAVAPSYAHPLIFLFLGGFLIAKALERWGLHRLVASAALRFSAGGAPGLIGSLMVATAFLSMWISNTAAAMVMVPIAQSVGQSIRSGAMPARDSANLVSALMLGVAFSATIGGMATLIGTPPNALLAGYLQTTYGVTIGFGRWMLMGVPIMAALLTLAWLVLTRVAFRFDRDAVPPIREMTRAARDAEEPLGPGARLTAVIAICAGLGLVFRPALAGVLPDLPLSDAGIVMLAALALFAIPAGDGSGERLLRWDDAMAIRWDVLILFGGGLTLASAIESSGLSQAMGAVFSSVETLPIVLVVLLAMTAMVYLGELASNTAMAAVFLPIAGAAAGGLGVAPLDLVLPIGLAASLGFMLPVATPPNAIVYATGAVSSTAMMRAGAVLDIVSIPIVYGIALTLGAYVVGQ